MERIIHISGDAVSVGNETYKNRKWLAVAIMEAICEIPTAIPRQEKSRLLKFLMDSKTNPIIRNLRFMRREPRHSYFYFSDQNLRNLVVIDGVPASPENVERRLRTFRRVEERVDPRFSERTITDLDAWTTIFKMLANLRMDSNSIPIKKAKITITDEAAIVIRALTFHRDIRMGRFMNLETVIRKDIDESAVYDARDYLEEMQRVVKARGQYLGIADFEDTQAGLKTRSVISPTLASYQEEINGYAIVRRVRSQLHKNIDNPNICSPLVRGALHHFARGMALAAIGQRLGRTIDCAADTAGTIIEFSCKEALIDYLGGREDSVIRSLQWFVEILKVISISSAQYSLKNAVIVAMISVRRIHFALSHQIISDNEIISLTKDVHDLIFQKINLPEIPGIMDERFAAETLQYLMRTGFETRVEISKLTNELRTFRYLGRLIDDIESCDAKSATASMKFVATDVKNIINENSGFIFAWWRKNRHEYRSVIDGDYDVARKSRALGILPGRGSEKAIKLLSKRFKIDRHG